MCEGEHKRRVLEDYALVLLADEQDQEGLVEVLKKEITGACV